MKKEFGCFFFKREGDKIDTMPKTNKGLLEYDEKRNRTRVIIYAGVYDDIDCDLISECEFLIEDTKLSLIEGSDNSDDVSTLYEIAKVINKKDGINQPSFDDGIHISGAIRVNDKENKAIIFDVVNNSKVYIVDLADGSYETKLVYTEVQQFTKDELNEDSDRWDEVVEQDLVKELSEDYDW